MNNNSNRINTRDRTSRDSFGRLMRYEYYQKLWEYYILHDEVPTEQDVRDSTMLPRLTDYDDLFGSLEQCKMECGLYSEEIMNELVSSLQDINPPVCVDDIEHSPEWYDEHFGSLSYAIRLSSNGHYC